jgi:DNA-directed RNA polymerase specialized sigma24 family protein
LRHLEGWSLAQIAEHLGRSTQAAAGLIKRGLIALRSHLKTEEQR